MGCGSSQAVSVVQCQSARTTVQALPTRPQEVSSKPPVNELPPVSNKKPPSTLIPLPSKNKSADSGNLSYVDDEKSHEEMDNISERKNSISSDDSGYLDHEYRHIITEKSNPELITKVEKEFVEREGLELAINGKSCPPLLSQKEKENKNLREEKQSLELLRNTGLVQKPLAIKQNYATFEIVEEKLMSRNDSMQTLKSNSDTNSLAAMRAPPPRLLQRERTKTSLTAEMLEEKLEKAEKRKEEQLNQLKLRASRGSSATMNKRLNIKKTSNYYINPRGEEDDKFNNDLEERQKRLRAIRDKIRAKDAEGQTPRTPRSKDLASELENFRPKTPAHFKPEFN